MAKQLIPLYTTTLNKQPTDTISARDLHITLNLKQNFSEWISINISKMYFMPDQDFLMVDNMVRPTKVLSSSKEEGVEIKVLTDYLINLNMAYEIALAENTAQGQQVSHYLQVCITTQNHQIAILH